MPSNLLILALLAGFVFVRTCHLFRFRTRLLDGYPLLFESSLAGLVLLIVSRLVVCFSKLFPVFWMLRPHWASIVDLPYFGTFLLSVPLAYVSAKTCNIWLDNEKCRRKEVKNSGGYLLIFMSKALDENRIVSLSLDNRTWVSGLIKEWPELNVKEKYFRLLPARTGYQDKETLRVICTHRYEADYAERAADLSDNEFEAFLEDFVLTLPMASVRNASFYLEDSYEEQATEAAVVDPEQA